MAFIILYLSLVGKISVKVVACDFQFKFGIEYFPNLSTQEMFSFSLATLFYSPDLQYNVLYMCIGSGAGKVKMRSSVIQLGVFPRGSVETFSPQTPSQQLDLTLADTVYGVVLRKNITRFALCQMQKYMVLFVLTPALHHVFSLGTCAPGKTLTSPAKKKEKFTFTV